MIIIKPKWKEYSTALAALETRLTVELLFPSSIFQKYFLAESAAALEYMATDDSKLWSEKDWKM